MKEDIIRICKKNKEKESCGIIFFSNKRYRIKECKNISKNPENQFEISFLDHCECLKNGEIVGTYHSHVNRDENFSELDVKMSNEMMIPFIVYSLKTNKINVYTPKKMTSKRIKNFSNKIKDYIV